MQFISQYLNKSILFPVSVSMEINLSQTITWWKDRIYIVLASKKTPERN